MKKYRISLVNVHYISNEEHLYTFMVYRKFLFFWIPVHSEEGTNRNDEFDKCMEFISSKQGSLINKYED